MARRRRRAHKPTAKAKKAYAKNIVKAYHRLEKVVAEHAPQELVHRRGGTKGFGKSHGA